ncbi:MAG: acyltransferase [Ilumatobacteraceae bacterium]
MPATVETGAPLGHRPSLDGVRAFAVLLVAGVHTHPRLVPAGSIGVDIFFVLSGFLITTLLVEELDSRGRVSIGRFYIRRALRLLPALFGLLATVTAWALLVAAPDTRHNALNEVVAAASYTRNLTWWAHVPGTLLGHTWSLALEEQFYLVWPALLTMCLRPRRSSTWLATLFVAAFLTISALRHSGVVGPAALFIGRPDALLLGAALALVRRDRVGWWDGQAAARRAGAAVVVGTAGLLGIAAWDAGDNVFGIGYSLAALAAAALIYGLVVLHERGRWSVFGWPPAVAFGRVSYGFYLWHLPVLRWTDDRLIGEPAIVRIGIGFALALIATMLSYRVLEQPALRWKSRFAPFGPGRAASAAPDPDQSKSVPATKE